MANRKGEEHRKANRDNRCGAIIVIQSLVNIVAAMRKPIRTPNYDTGIFISKVCDEFPCFWFCRKPNRANTGLHGINISRNDFCMATVCQAKVREELV